MRTVVAATQQLRADEHLQLMLASEPGDVAASLTVDGLPVIFEIATAVPHPGVAPLDRRGPGRRAGRAASPRRHLLLPRPVPLRRPRRPRVGASASSATSSCPLHLTASEVILMSTTEEMIGRPPSTTSRPSCPSPTPTSTRSSTSSRTTPTPSSRGTTRWPGRRCASCTRRPRSASGTPPPTCRGTPRSTSRRSIAADQAAIGAGHRPGHLHRHARSRSGATRSGSSSASKSRHWTLSQFLHGEQGALLCTAKIVETVPWYDAKLYASTQVVDEARHVEVFARYLDEKLGGALPDQRPPADAARRHRQRQPLGHDLPRHAGHGRGPGAGRVRLHAPDDHRAAAQAAAALRDERRGPPRRLRRAQPEGGLRRA